MNTCVDCVHHNGGRGVWYNHRCFHPDVQRVEEKDPVTGERCFAEKNDLGRLVLTDNASPYCRDLNHGNCSKWEGR